MKKYLVKFRPDGADEVNIATFSSLENAVIFVRALKEYFKNNKNSFVHLYIYNSDKILDII